jgi:acyl carrier protein
VPSPSSVHDQLTDILVRVVGCSAEAVVPAATLKKLGTDSLTVIEVADELGRRFGVRLPDDTINALRTVQDGIDAIVRHDGSQSPRSSAQPKTRSFQ